MKTIIDMHAHIFPEKISLKATTAVGDFYDTKMPFVGNSETLLKLGRAAGVTKYVVHSVATTPHQVRSINDYIAAQCAEHPEFIGFGALHPDCEDIGCEVERIISLGLKGIKLHPDFQRFLIDDDKAMPIYEAAEGRLPIIFHTGDYRYEWSKPQRLAWVIDRFPRLDCVAAHFGGWSEPDTAITALLERRCWVDTSSTYGFLSDPDKVYSLLELWGADRIMFGSDFPMWDPKNELAWLAKCGLPEEDMEKILHGNIEKLLNITED